MTRRAFRRKVSASPASPSVRPHTSWICATSCSKRSQEQPRLRRERAPRRLDHHEFGVQFGRDDRVDDQFAAADVVDRDHARQNRHPVGARDEFERGDHGVHFQHGLDFDAVALEIGFEIAPADIVRPRHHEFQRLAFGEPQRRQRRQSALCARDQHFAVAHQQTRFQPDGALEGRHHREVEFARRAPFR